VHVEEAFGPLVVANGAGVKAFVWAGSQNMRDLPHCGAPISNLVGHVEFTAYLHERPMYQVVICL
jgi:hypothetical protein